MHFTMPMTQKLKKLIKSLQQKQFRDMNGLFLAEGEKITSELLKSDYHVELVVIKDSPSQDVAEYVEQFADKGVAVYTAPKHQFDQLCDTKTPQNILAIVNIKTQELMPDENFVALDGIADPGNVGTIMRTAAWFGVKQIILGRDTADAYNPKTVRSTMGAIFKTNFIYTPNLGSYLSENFPKFKIFGASLDATKKIQQIKPQKHFGIVFGNEARGLSEDVEKIINDRFLIEGFGDQESLNVAVSAGISLYHFTGAK